MSSLLRYLSDRTPYLRHPIANLLTRGKQDRMIGCCDVPARSGRMLPDTAHARPLELIGLAQLYAMLRACAPDRLFQTEKQDRLIEEFVLEIIRTAEHHGRSKLFLDWSLVSRSFEIELAFLAIRTNRHGVLQVRAANSLEASVTHAKRLGRSVFDPRVQLFAAEVGGRQQALAAHYENRTVCSVRIASNFERLAIGNRQVRATGRAPLQRGWSRRSNPVSDDRASEMSCIGLSREFDADELSDVLLPYVGDYVS